MKYLNEDEATQMMGAGYLGEVRQGPDGNLYQWVQGVDGLGNPVGFWKKLKGVARAVTRPVVNVAQQAWRLAKKPYCIPLQAIPGPIRQVARQVCGVVNKLQPLAHVPVVGNYYQGINKLCSIARDCGIAGMEGNLMQASDGTLYQIQGLCEGNELSMPTNVNGIGYADLGALYQAPDGTLYQMQGLSEDEELRGLAEDEELRGLDEDEELRGFAEDEELRGLEEDEELRGLAEEEELRGFAEDEEVRGFAEDEELRGLDQGYVREPGTSGLEAYVPQTPPQTRWFNPPAQSPELWKPLW